ncbi:hypothetical protein TNCV_3140991 [Trichonephila clavipes]|nr:hypothetical protein TNCV_3140991 [Trichonephila clavipes]
MSDPSSFASPTPLAHADTSRDVLPRGGKLGILDKCQLAIFVDRRPRISLSLSPYTIINHSIKRRKSDDPVCAIYGKSSFAIGLTSTVGDLTYADMHFTYGCANGNSTAALRMYHVQFPDRRLPDHRIFQWLLHCQLRKLRSFHVTRHDARRRLKESILNVVADRPSQVQELLLIT